MPLVLFFLNSKQYSKIYLPDIYIFYFEYVNEYLSPGALGC
jgi:hypothetical protein